MTLKKNIFFYVFLFSINLFSQKVDDKEIMRILEIHSNINHDSTLHYAKKLQYSKNPEQVISGLTSEARAYYRKKDYENSKKSALKLIETSEKGLQDSNALFYYDGKISGYNRLFWIYKNKEDYTRAFHYITLMEQGNEKRPIKDTKHLLINLSIKLSKATIKKALKMNINAKNILLSAYKDTQSDLLREENNKNIFLQQKANILNSLGNIYMSLNYNTDKNVYLDSASYFHKKSFEVTQYFKPLHNDSEIMYNFRKADVLIAKKNYPKAIQLINNYNKIAKGYQYQNKSYYQKAICYHNLKKADSSIYYAAKLLANKTEKCERSKLITMYDILSKEYYKTNQIDSAYKYSKQTLELYDLAKKNKEETLDLLYHNSFKNAKQLNLNLQNKNNDSYFLYVFISLLLTLIALVFYLFRKEKIEKKQLITQINEVKIVEKKEYNIDVKLERLILDEFKMNTEKLSFLTPDFSISSIADKLNTNSTYISFVFNKNYNEPFKQYFTRLRIEHVVNLLKTKPKFRLYSMQALAEEIGYNSTSAFTRAFKKQVGVSPSVFLKTLEN